MPLVEVENLTKSYGTTEAVRGITFGIERGHCVALLGPNGAGKTTTLRILAGLIQPTRGTLRFNGESETDIRPYLGYLPQNPGFHEWMTGREFLMYVGQLAGLNKLEAKQRSEFMLARLGLEAAATRPIRGYSGGMKQRLGICQALIHRPQLLILDEPVSALDPIGRRDILKLLADIRHETTVLYSTHVLHDAEEISDDVIILVEGKTVVAGPLNEVRQRNQRARIEMTAETSLESFHPLWASLPSVERVEGLGTRVTILAKNVGKARDEILQTVMHHHIPVQHIEFGQSTLEDLFMEVMKS